MKVCFHSPTWLALPDRSYECLGKWDALYCGATEQKGRSELVALCDEHRTLHWLGIYGDDELMMAFECIDRRNGI